jgi:triosephosphate isomerase
MNRKIFIAGNWKMNKTVSETLSFYTDLEKKLSENNRLEVVIFPPFTSLYAAGQVSNLIKTGAQNLYFEDKGAFTAEISASMVKELCDYVLIGHSERRNIFLETDENISRKVKKALEYDLKPVLCIGETREERDTGKTFETIEEQLNLGLDGLTTNQIDKCIIAYEPVWAIGTGLTATPEQAQEVHAYIRASLNSKTKNGDKLLILYGGSVKPGNSFELLSQKDIDGALIGGASLHVEDFLI